MSKIAKFGSQVNREMRKVAWPTREELVASTVVVIVSTFILALFIGICDMLARNGVNLLISGGLF